MISMLDEMPRIKTLIIDSADKEELNKYYDSHEGFYQMRFCRRYKFIPKSIKIVLGLYPLI